MAATVYIDFDDVLCETARALAGLLQREFGRTVAFESIHTFDLGKSFSLRAGELDRLMEMGHQPEFLRTLEPVPRAAEALRRWSDAGLRLAVVTGRPPVTRPPCEAWLRAHGIPFDELIFVNKYGRTLMQDHEVQALSLDELAVMPFALAVEDAPGMVAFLLEHTRVPVAIMDRPWNRQAAFPSSNGRGIRCRDWAAIAERFPFGALR